MKKYFLLILILCMSSVFAYNPWDCDTYKESSRFLYLPDYDLYCRDVLGIQPAPGFGANGYTTIGSAAVYNAVVYPESVDRSELTSEQIARANTFSAKLQSLFSKLSPPQPQSQKAYEWDNGYYSVLPEPQGVVDVFKKTGDVIDSVMKTASPVEGNGINDFCAMHPDSDHCKSVNGNPLTHPIGGLAMALGLPSLVAFATIAFFVSLVVGYYMFRKWWLALFFAGAIYFLLRWIL